MALLDFTSFAIVFWGKHRTVSAASSSFFFRGLASAYILHANDYAARACVVERWNYGRRAV
jgi:hypothetical protein